MAASRTAGRSHRDRRRGHVFLRDPLLPDDEGSGPGVGLAVEIRVRKDRRIDGVNQGVVCRAGADLYHAMAAIGGRIGHHVLRCSCPRSRGYAGCNRYCERSRRRLDRRTRVSNFYCKAAGLCRSGQRATDCPVGSQGQARGQIAGTHNPAVRGRSA